MAYIEERINQDGKVSYRVQIRLKGYPKTCATFERKTDAKLWAQQTESAMREGRYFKTAEVKKHTLSDLIARYLSQPTIQKNRNLKDRIAHLKWWEKELGYCLLADLTPSLIGSKRDELLKGLTSKGTPRSPATVVRYMASLSHALSIAMKEYGWIEDSPIRKVSKPREARGRVRFLVDQEREKLLAACQNSTNPFLYPIFVLALSTGMRQAEIMNLNWNDIDFDRQRIILHQTKNGERRSVPLQGLALQLIQKLKSTNRLNFKFLFPSKDETKPLYLRSPWEQAVKLASIQNFHFHHLRHSCASYLLMNGASLAEIAEILGHKTLAMVKRYSHMSEIHASKVVERMNKLIFS